MVKLVFCLRRQRHLSREEFQRYWRETHGPLVKARDEVLGMRRYVQVHTVDARASEALRASRGGPEPYDGVAEAWFDSWDALVAAGSTPEGRQAGRELIEDERRFIDLTNSPVWIGEEHPFVE